ncbi:hypothetical protein [Marisediminicola sp. LYQ134]|uniref:hypothetical protein n=1 Tax=unclassified Marisediminicola TaxID=2618316 RepID=UPI0039831384
MTPTTTGMAIGAILALTAVAFDFGALLLVAFFIAVGYGIGRFVEGKLDVRGLADAFRGRRSS